jgi:hypothetical protein
MKPVLNALYTGFLLCFCTPAGWIIIIALTWGLSK